MKKAGLIIGGIVAVVVLAAVALVLLVDVNQYRGEIESRLATQLGRDVTLGEMSLGLLPLRLEAAETVIGEDPVLGDRPPFVQTERLAVRVGLLSLLRGEVRVESLELERPSVELVRKADGTWNFSTLGSGAVSEGPEAPPDSDGGAAARPLVLDRLAIRDGMVALSRLGPTETRSVYDHIDLTLRDYAPGQPFSFDIAAHIQGEGAQELRLAGTAGPVMLADPLTTPFNGTLGLDEVGVEGLKAFLGTEALADAGGSLSGESELENRSGVIDSRGNLELENARFNGIEVGYPISVAYDGEADLAGMLFEIRSATVRLGETPLDVSGSLDAASSPARLDLNISSGEVEIQEIARLASTFGVFLPTQVAVDGRVGANVHVGGSTARPTLNGTIAGRDLVLSGNGIAQPVEVRAIDLELSPDTIQSNEFEIASGDTRATGSFALQGYATENRRIDARLQAPGATLPEIQSIARAYGVTSLDQIEGQGLLNADLRASGPVAGFGSPDVARLVNGDINLDFSPLEVSGFNAARELGVIAGFTGEGDENLTDIVRLTGQIAVRNGIARTDDLVAELGIGSLSAAGTADLATRTLDMRGLAVLNQAFSERVGGTNLGGYLTTALSNSAGEIVIPVLVTGDFEQPRFRPDVQTFARMQRDRLLENPGATVSGILDALRGGGNADTEAPTEEAAEGESLQEETRPEDAIRDILGGILGGRRSEEPE